MNDVLSGYLEGLLGSSTPNMSWWAGVTMSHVTLAILILAVSVFVGSRIRRGVRLFFNRTKGDTGLELLIGRLAYMLTVLIGILAIFPIFGISATALFGALGFLGLAVSLAIQDVLKNAIAGIYLLIERPFRPGETIRVRDYLGTVETVDLRTTTLRSEGEIVYVPNAILYAEILVNRGQLRQKAKEVGDAAPEEPHAARY
jgi:small conductance mechanosensitive channel